MALDITRLTTEVEETKTATQSAITLLNTLAEEIRANAGNAEALNTLADELDANANALAEAVAANTPGSEPDLEPTPEEPTV